MLLDNARSLKHELRTPVNHIIGYSALLLETAEDTQNDTLARLVSEINDLGNQLSKLIERNLISSERTISPEDIRAIQEAISPVMGKIVENLAAGNASVDDDAEQADLQRISSAVDRLHSVLHASLVEEEQVEQVQGRVH